MNINKETKVGIFVVAVLLILAYFSVKVGKIRIFKPPTYTISAYFKSANGIGAGTAVTMAGIKIGTVEKISLSGFEVGQLLSDKFLTKIRTLDKDIDPIAIILIKFDKTEKKPNDKKIKEMPIIIQLGHESNKDVENKIIHVSSTDSTFVEQIKNVIKDLGD